MRTITKALLAIGFIGAMASGAPISSNAQVITFGGPGVDIEIVTRPYAHRHARYDQYYGHQRYAHQYYRGPNGQYGVWQSNPPSTY